MLGTSAAGGVPVAEGDVEVAELEGGPKAGLSIVVAAERVRRSKLRGVSKMARVRGERAA